MKKISLILTFIALSNLYVFAQESGFGIKGGINLSTYKFSASGISVTPDRAVKARIGVFYNNMINDEWAVQFEGLYSGTGYKPESGSGVDKITLNYIAFPVMFKYYPSEKFNIHAGPELGFFLGGKADDEDIDEGVKTIDLGLGIGAEISLADNARLSARYTFGLVNTNDSDLDVTQKSDNIELAVLIGF